MGKGFDVKARMRKIKADPKIYIGVLERAIKRRNEVIAVLRKNDDPDSVYRLGYWAGLCEAESICKTYILKHSQRDIDGSIEACLRVRAAQRILDRIVKNREAMLKQQGTSGKDVMKAEYDFSKGVRGKYAARYAEGVKRVRLARYAELSRSEVVKALKRLGWKKTKHGWYSPTHKLSFQGFTLRKAASLAALSSNEDLGGY